MVKINKEAVALVLLVGAVLTNPLSNQVVVEYVERGLIFVSRTAGVYVTLVAAAYFVGYILWNMWTTREKVNIPSKSAKTNKVKYLES